MTDALPPFGDPTTARFWEAAARGELLIQRCAACDGFQFYPRPFCLACDAADPAWVRAAGTGTVYATTTVHLRVDPAREPPYVVAVVELDEGPRMVSSVIGDPAAIGDRVELAWQPRDGAPPLPVFVRAGGGT